MTIYYFIAIIIFARELCSLVAEKDAELVLSKKIGCDTSRSSLKNLFEFFDAVWTGNYILTMALLAVPTLLFVFGLNKFAFISCVAIFVINMPVHIIFALKLGKIFGQDKKFILANAILPGCGYRKLAYDDSVYLGERISEEEFNEFLDKLKE